MRSLIACLTGILALGACRVPLNDAESMSPWHRGIAQSPEPGAAVVGGGAAPGNAKGPGGFVPRGSARNFYTGPGGRLWYYMNNYYWVSPTAPREDLWIKAEVREKLRDLRRWPDGKRVADSEPKVTVEYWEVAPSGRTVWVDNHKDYVGLDDKYTAGAITVDVTLTLGHLTVMDDRDRWGPADEPYVLESRNYRKKRGIGAQRVRFKPLATEAVTTWSYRVPWDTHPQRLTRSNWQKLALPTWRLAEQQPPPRLPDAERVVTPTATEPDGS